MIYQTGPYGSLLTLTLGRMDQVDRSTLPESCLSMLETVEEVMRICREMQEEQEVKFVDEDVEDDEDVDGKICITVNYLQEAENMRMLIDSGAPVSLISSDWLEKYMRNTKMEDGVMERSADSKRFRLGRTVYESKEKVTFSM